MKDNMEGEQEKHVKEVGRKRKEVPNRVQPWEYIVEYNVGWKVKGRAQSHHHHHHHRHQAQ
jgi:hypothetical protein